MLACGVALGLADLCCMYYSERTSQLRPSLGICRLFLPPRRDIHAYDINRVFIDTWLHSPYGLNDRWI